MPPVSLHYGLDGVLESLLPSHTVVMLYVQGNVSLSWPLFSPVDLVCQLSLCQFVVLGDRIYL